MENRDVFSPERSDFGGEAPNIVQDHHDDHQALSNIIPDAISQGIELVPFPPSDSFFPQEASQLAPADVTLASSSRAEILCFQEYNTLAIRSHQNDDLLHQPNIHDESAQTASSQLLQEKLSVEDLVRIAASKFVQSHSNDDDSLPISFAVPHLEAALSEDESESVALAHLLFEAAEKVGERAFDVARPLLQQCDWRSSPTGNPIQRLVFYYSRALRERIDRETGRMASRYVATEQSFDLYKVVMTPSVKSIDFHTRIPFSQATQFAGIQAIVEHVEGARRIHVVDLAVRNGQQWVILMQALASRPKRRRAHSLKITAVVTLGKELTEQTGSRLVSFGETLGLPCSFHVVVVPDLAQLGRDHIQLESGEVVAVLAEYVVSTLTEPVDRLDSLIRALRSLNPCVMVVGELEGNMNSPIFVNRFVEALFLASTFFDFMEECMGRDEPARKYGEATLFGESSKIILAIEGRERIIRTMKLDVWRAYFQRMGMVEKEMSRSSMYHAELVAKKLPCWRPCTVKMDGKGLMIGWKGTPIKSVTAWYFM